MYISLPTTGLYCSSNMVLCGSCDNVEYRTDVELSPTSFSEKWFNTEGWMLTNIGMISTTMKITICANYNKQKEVNIEIQQHTKHQQLNPQNIKYNTINLTSKMV